jgi:hypothetical protein
LTSIRAVDNKTVFTDVMNKPFTLETFPSDKAKFDASFGTVIKEGRTTKVILGFTITSATTFGKLKQAIMPVLQRCSTFMRPHLSTSWKSLDTITIGHLHLLHPTFADTDKLRRKMDQQLTDTAIRIRDNPDFHKILSAHLKRDCTLRVPEIMFYPGRAMGKLIPNQFLPTSLASMLLEHQLPLLNIFLKRARKILLGLLQLYRVILNIISPTSTPNFSAPKMIISKRIATLASSQFRMTRCTLRK